jgi:hypothetical protein
MFPVLLIAIGVVVLLLGKRIAVLGAAVGALLGLVLLSLLSITSFWLMLAIVGGLAALGFFAAGFAKGIVNIIIIVIGALAGASIVMSFLDLFGAGTGFVSLLLGVVGGVVGVVLVQRFKEMAVTILAGLVGGLLVVHGLAIWLPFLTGTIGTILVLVLAGGAVAYQGGLINKPKEAPAKS